MAIGSLNIFGLGRALSYSSAVKGVIQSKKSRMAICTLAEKLCAMLYCYSMLDDDQIADGYSLRLDRIPPLQP